MKKLQEEFPIEKMKKFVYNLLRKGPMFYREVSLELIKAFGINKTRIGWFLHDMYSIGFYRKYPHKKMHAFTVIYIIPSQREIAVPMYINWLKKNVPENFLGVRSRRLHVMYLHKVQIMRERGMNRFQISEVLDVPPSRVSGYIEELTSKGRL